MSTTYSCFHRRESDYKSVEPFVIYDSYACSRYFVLFITALKIGFSYKCKIQSFKLHLSYS